ncbi:MAG TPA: hypothetical protein VL442_22930 [Mucilaginibacter sp.]|jgi:hypothetical protein|nr:hypothetical protein [Mucilaginibacter sp.]
MRGQTSIINQLPISVTSNPANKGFRNVHLDKRDDALAARFYYYHHIKRMRYDDILLRLEKEFFITPGVITQRLQVRADFMKALSNNNTDANKLRREYPQFSWN